MSHKRIKVLYIEDDPADVDFVQSALQQTVCDGFELSVMDDGEQAVKFVEGDEKFKALPRPQLVLLDLNLPKVSGKEILKALKSKDLFKKVPVIIFSTSAARPDVEETYALGASGFITKPMNFDGYKSVMKKLHDYWLTVCTVPEKN